MTSKPVVETIKQTLRTLATPNRIVPPSYDRFAGAFG
jgi:hypothetical protein